ncbi:MAG: hypothetical protein J0L93_03360 [Deltaproteobacteria bacterium]|nr:hypothetical protein [Deltaproteobacteria bacterium]
MKALKLHLIYWVLSMGLLPILQAQENPAEMKNQIIQKIQLAQKGLNIFQVVPGATAVQLNFTLLEKGVEDLWTILFFQSDEAYLSGKTTANSNQGLIRYLSNELSQNPDLLAKAIDFYSQLQKIDEEKKNEVDPSLLDKAPVDAWKLAIDITNNPREALFLIALFGHNDRTEDLISNNGNDEKILKLNQLKPKRNSVLFFQGSLAGVQPSQKTVNQVVDATKECKKLNIECPGGAEARYYHVLAAAFIASELIYKEDNFQLPVLGSFPEFITVEVGYRYKKKTIFETYMKNPDAHELYNIGYRQFQQKDFVDAPKDWSAERYLKAKTELDFFLANLNMGISQYRAGAQFAEKVNRTPHSEKK